MRTTLRRMAGAGAVAFGTVIASLGSAVAETPACREWRAEHRQWKAEAMRRYLAGASQRALDEAVFEMLQREAYLTACDLRVEAARCEMVGWRLVGRDPDEFGSAVIESLLAEAGFEVELRDWFQSELPGLRSAARDDTGS